MSRARFLRAATTGEKISSDYSKEYLDEIFQKYATSIDIVLRENKKSTQMVLICEKMTANLILLSNSPQADNLLSQRGLTFEKSLIAMLK